MHIELISGGKYTASTVSTWKIVLKQKGEIFYEKFDNSPVYFHKKQYKL